jgi:hypothetical protein
MRRYLAVLGVMLLTLAACGWGQTASTPATTTCAAGSTPPYAYFAIAGITYDYYGRTPAVTSGFGVKTGACSNAFLVTNIDTALGQNSSYATLRESLEYHLARSGNWTFLGKGLVGVVTATSAGGTVTQAMFAGGVSVTYDLGWKLSKGKLHLPVAGQFLYVAITATQVKPTYGIEFRKTF